MTTLLPDPDPWADEADYWLWCQETGTPRDPEIMARFNRAKDQLLYYMDRFDEGPEEDYA